MRKWEPVEASREKSRLQLRIIENHSPAAKKGVREENKSISFPRKGAGMFPEPMTQKAYVRKGVVAKKEHREKAVLGRGSKPSPAFIKRSRIKLRRLT